MKMIYLLLAISLLSATAFAATPEKVSNALKCYRYFISKSDQYADHRKKFDPWNDNPHLVHVVCTEAPDNFKAPVDCLEKVPQLLSMHRLDASFFCKGVKDEADTKARIDCFRETNDAVLCGTFPGAFL